MCVKRNNRLKGVTLIELVVTIIAAVILLLGITGILAGGIKNFRTMYNRTTSEVVVNSYEARIIFDRIVREAIIEHEEINNERDDLTVFYYSDPNGMSSIEYPDRYANFYLINDDTELIVVTGVLNIVIEENKPWDWRKEAEIPPTLILAKNVDDVEFTIEGASIRMSLTLDNESGDENTNKLETLEMDVTTTAIRHNRLPD